MKIEKCKLARASLQFAFFNFQFAIPAVRPDLSKRYFILTEDAPLELRVSTRRKLPSA